MALQGMLLFLFIPLVLVLYLRMPFGLAPSILGGIAIMLAHRPVARPWMERHRARRCFWCGQAVGPDAVAAPFLSRRAVIDARACSAAHRDRLHAFGRSVAAARPLLAALILLPVALYLVNALAALAEVPLVPLEAAKWGFKIPIATAVVALSFLWPAGFRMTRPPAIDFPVHNLFLLGVRNTLWVFRVVGIWWLAEGAWRLAGVVLGAAARSGAAIVAT
jgi:hypothetical protein